ncbi:MAG: copper chaperone PCu(A)C [Rhodospirillales bacterium]|nr:copper chaperone PCu(A)C [Rhodospirillales bacterium]
MTSLPSRAMLLLALVLALPAGAAEQANAGHVRISKAWARASAGQATTGAAFLTLDNDGPPDRLIRVEAKLSKSVELHNHVRDGEVMRMRRVDAIELPNGKTVTLAPGGLHVMFIGLAAPLKEGSEFPLTLVFEKSGSATVTVLVHGVGAKSADDHGGHSHKH